MRNESLSRGAQRGGEKSRPTARRDRDFLREYPSGESYGSIEQTSYPGATDVAYRARRATIVDASMSAWPLLPRYQYLPEEQATWRHICRKLIPLQDAYACEAFLEGGSALNLPLDEIPQLDDVSALLEAKTGVMLAPVGGLLEAGDFLSALADRVMRCTAYMRHHEHPEFTPEPDIIHELWGHAPMFMNSDFVSFSKKIGDAAKLAVEQQQGELLRRLQLLYWYTIEYGLIEERGQLKIFGAGNSAGLQDLHRSLSPSVKKRPLSAEIYQLTVDYDQPQEVFYVAESFSQIEEMVSALLQESASLEPR